MYIQVLGMPPRLINNSVLSALRAYVRPPALARELHSYGSYYMAMKSLAKGSAKPGSRLPL